MANLIPMAGEGTRFSKEGYNLPKPLIPISGQPMILKVIENLPKANKWIFVVRQEHIDDYKLDEVIKSKIPNPIIISVTETTEGQASTCMLAEKYLEDNEPLLIAACDNGFVYNKEEYNKLISNNTIDSVIWTFTQHENLRTNPKAWGWVKLAADNLTIKDVSIKIPISETPFNDHAVVATFFFKKAKDFFDATKLMIKENHRINKEFYIDAIPIFLNKLNKRSVIFDVELYIGWGTPADLELYQQKEFEAKFTSKKGIELWRRYFNG